MAASSSNQIPGIGKYNDENKNIDVDFDQLGIGHIYDATNILKHLYRLATGEEDISAYHNHFSENYVVSFIINEVNKDKKPFSVMEIGFSSIIVEFLPQLTEMIRIARKHDGLPYGGFVRGLVEYLLGDHDYGNYSILCGDVDFWFQDREKSKAFLAEISSKESRKETSFVIFDESYNEDGNEFNEDDGAKPCYGFTRKKFNVCYPYRETFTTKATSGLLTIFSMDVIVSEDCIPISDMAVNCLTYDIKTGKFESQNPNYTDQELIDQILAKEVHLITPGTFSHDLPLYHHLIGEDSQLVKGIPRDSDKYCGHPGMYEKDLEKVGLTLFSMVRLERLNTKFLSKGWHLVA